MKVTDAHWSTQEKEIAKAALRTAQNREIQLLVEVVRERASEVATIDDVWRLNDFLSARRFDIDGKYDDREGEILFVLAKLTKDGWLASEDLLGLEPSKLSKITALTRVL